MKKTGYIKLYRALEDWSWIDEPTMVYFWVRLLLMANWEDKEWHGKTIPRGSIVTTVASLAKTLKLSVKQVRTCIERLKKGKEICVSTANNSHLITICKYEDYQGDAANEGQIKGKCLGKESVPPYSPSLSSPTTPSITPPISPSEEEGKKESEQGACAPAYTREQGPYPPTPFPFSSPFTLSSMERHMCRSGQYDEPYFKRQHLAANLKVIADQYGMSEQVQKQFLDYYCRRSDNNHTEIFAEKTGHFDLRYYVEGWMKRENAAKQEPPSRIEQYAEKSNRITKIIDELFAEREPGPADGSAIPPDEQ